MMRLVNRACLLANKGLNQNVFDDVTGVLMDLWLNSAKNRKFWDERELKVIPELPLPTSTLLKIVT